jgi:AraC family transcriptional regulator of arabinose operon
MLKKYLKLNAFFHDILNSSLACVIHISEERMILEQAIRYLKSNLFYQRSIEEIACAVAIPIRKLILLFRKYTGITPIQYFNFLKMQKAAHLLLTSDLRVNEVGREVGLADSLYFSRLFRGHAGIAPKNYRFSFISDQETSPTVQHLHG